MSLSFGDSLKKSANSNEFSVMAMSLEDAGVMTTALEEEGNWHKVNKSVYRFYERDYSDSSYSTVDEFKSITLDPKQINITQEQNSQYIPFKMSRYYDGFDLTKTELGIFYVNENNESHSDIPVDVYYNDDSIRFAWLVSEFATRVSGILKFEIQARGTNEKGETYVWKSKSYDKMNVIQSLAEVATGEIGLTEEELDSWYNRIQIESQNAQSAATRAETAASKAQSLVTELESGMDSKVNTAVDNKIGTVVGDEIAKQLNDYYTKAETYSKTEVDTAIAGVDVSEQLKNYVTQTALSENHYTKTETESQISDALTNYATQDYVANEIGKADISDKLKDYYKSSETYNKTEIDNKVANVQVDLSGYATEDYVTTREGVLNTAIEANKSSIQANSENITKTGELIGALQSEVNSIDKSPRFQYEATYNADGDATENLFTLYQIENKGMEDEVRETVSQFTITGGSGGASASNKLYVNYDKDEAEKNITSYVFTAENRNNGETIIYYGFYGEDAVGDAIPYANATWKIRKGTSGSWTTIKTETIYPGEHNAFNIDSKHIASIGSYSLKVEASDDNGGFAAKTWSVQVIDVRIESSFNDATTYPIGKVSFNYTPYGSISKKVHFILDGNEIDTATTTYSGVPMACDIPSQNHGSHLLETYITAVVGEKTIESNHVFKDIMWCDSTSDIPIIGCNQQNISLKQYDSVNIQYTVYDPSTGTPTVKLAIDDEAVSELTLDSATNIWQYKPTASGSHKLTITCGETTKTIKAEVEAINIDVEPVTAGLAFDFNPVGRSNSSADRLWSDRGVSMTVSDNFDWINGGYQIDKNGDQYFCVKAGTRAVVNYNLFNDDPKKNGKEFKAVFKTTNVKNRDASFISCMDNNIGLDMKVESANIYSSNDSLYSPYCEDDIIEFEFNINKDTDIPMVLTYEDGVANRPMIYTADTSFMQIVPQPITIGSADCDVHIYRMKVYSNSLNDSDILSNFIADARDAKEMVSRYNRNQIYDENSSLDPYILAEKCPDLRVILIDCPRFTTDKGDKVAGTNITMIYKNGDPVLDNWTCTGAKHSGQGTSSNEYGYAGRNLDLIMDGDDALFTLGDGETTSKTIALTRNSTPTDYLNLKVNIASSENQNNALMTMRFNEYQPYIRPARLRDSKIRDCMEFYNAVCFVREYNEDLSTHNEFTDTLYHYYALGNIGDSKKTDDTRVFDSTDPKEFCIEVMDYNVALAEFPTGYTGSDGKKAICPESEWKKGNPAYDYLYADYKYKDGKFKSFGSESYEFRYEKDGITTEERQANIDAWREAYKFVVTSDDKTFKSDFSKYFVQDSILYFYLFTERYTLVDNRAKNLFINYAKAYFTEQEAADFEETYGVAIQPKYIDDVQGAFNEGYRFNLTWGYDFDTALGISNTGKLEITYGKEDIDYYTDNDPASGYIFRAAESTFFRRVRNLFPTELEAMFIDRESANAWSSSGLINQWDAAQSQFPEEIWRLDIQRKYLRTYQGISIDNSIAGAATPRFLAEMLNGRKKYQRRMFERNQELYFATKYFGTTATQDQIMMRFNNPVGAAVKQDFTLYLTPYSDMYIGVKFGNFTPVNFRAKAGVEYTIPYGNDTADITLIYGASFIQAIGDLSKCYVGDNDFSKASRLQSLIIGSGIENYENTFMTKISLGNNKLLEYLDVKNVTGLSTVIDLSQCGNLLELHAEGSGATGVVFANGGKLQKAYLPPVISLTMKNLNYIEEFDIKSYNNLQTLTVENTPFINTYEIVSSADKLNILRLIGMNWDESYHIEDASILNRLLTLSGVDNDGYGTPVSALSGSFYASVVKQKELENYINAWKDLEIAYSTLIEQYTVTFVNDNGVVLEVQYVDKGGNAVDPTTRAENPIIPTKESSVEHDYAFAGWDSNLTNVFADRTITATYSESLRSYTIKYVSKGVVVQSSTGLYGENVPYTGNIPTYTAEESGYVFYLFNRWDKSGFIDGEKTVNAIFDKFEYNENSFSGKELSDLSPVEIYAMNKLSLEKNIVTDKDPYTITVGNDIDYDDITSQLLISEKTHFDGSNYVDTGLKLFEEDKDFVLAIDYEFLSGNKANAVLAQCFQANGSNGFKLWYSNNSSFMGAKFSWGTTSDNVVGIGKREVIVIRHKKGDKNLTIYKSNLDGDEVLKADLTLAKSTIGTGALVFGCARADDGLYENHAIGDINWAKVWFADLGEETCKSLAMWTHETIRLEACGFKKYYLSNDVSKRCSFSLLASHLLDRTKVWNTSNTNNGGWAESKLNKSLNTRLYEAMPVQIKQLLKQVKVSSNDGITTQDNSSHYTEVTSSNCYITIPSIVELDSTKDSEPYNSEGTFISYLISNDSRKRAFAGGDYNDYWTRSPSTDWANYVWRVDKNGAVQGVTNPTNSLGVLIEISF